MKVILAKSLAWQYMQYQVEPLSFMCFNSCFHNSHFKCRIDVIFTLENK